MGEKHDVADVFCDLRMISSSKYMGNLEESRIGYLCQNTLAVRVVSLVSKFLTDPDLSLLSR